MNKGLLIYNPEDYEKNKWFVSEMLQKAAAHHLSLTLVLRNHLMLSIDEKEGPVAFQILDMPITFSNTSVQTASHRSSTSEKIRVRDAHSNHNLALKPNEASEKLCRYFPLKDIDFVINRTRDSLIGKHFEKMGCKVFNNSEVTEICNHKGKTHQLVNSHGIPSVKTILGNVHYFSPTMLPFSYPVVLKSVSGHGGSEVYLLKNELELATHFANLRTEDFILQEPCTNPGVDIRVFALGGEIVAAVKRFCPTDFKSNYSLGGSATAYHLQPHEKQLVEQILSLLPFDFIGIDFILNQEGDLLFNEIEDVVGTRTLYLNYPDIDIVDQFLSYIDVTLTSAR